MKINEIITLAILMIFGCCTPKGLTNLKAIEYMDYGLTRNADSTSGKAGGSFRIIYSQNCTVYKVWSINYKIVKSTLQQDTINNELIPTTDTTFKYFVVNNEDKRRLAYEDVGSRSNGIKFNLDSLRERLAINESNMKIFSLNLGKPSKIEKNGRSKKIEKYYTKIESNDADSIYRYYDTHLKDIKFSFSQKLDSINESKLYKTRFIYLSKNKPREELITEIKEVKLLHPKKILQLLAHFKDDYNNKRK